MPPSPKIWGLLGAAVVITLFLVLVARIFRVALLAEDPFGQLMTAGLAVTLAVQAFIILGGATGLIPLTGVPLPFVSYGGTSLFINFILLGLVLKVAERLRNTDVRPHPQTPIPIMGEGSYSRAIGPPLRPGLGEGSGVRARARGRSTFISFPAISPPALCGRPHDGV